MKRFRRAIAIPAMAVALAGGAKTAMAQAIIGGGGGGGGAGDAIVQYFYTNYMHAIAAAGLLAILVGAMFMRSHLIYFVVLGIALLCIGNYQTILGMFNL